MILKIEIEIKYTVLSKNLRKKVDVMIAFKFISEVGIVMLRELPILCKF